MPSISLFTARLLAIVIGVLPLLAGAQPTRILFIGNSYTYTNDLPGMVAQLALSAGEELETTMVAPGGYTFQGHTTYGPTQAAIAQGDWDLVVLQEQSQLPSFSPSQVAQQVLPYATQLVQQVHAASPCAEVIFLMTWGRENGDADNCAFYPPVCTYDGMQQRLRDSYVLMATDNDSWCAPVGAVWRAYRATHPADGLYSDGSHPNVLGSYIAASTLVSTLLRHSVINATYEPAGLLPGQGLDVRTLASAIVVDSTVTWNIGVNDPVADGGWTAVGGNTVVFVNNSVGTTGQSWDFGDGAMSTDADPMHTYANAGSYTATLVVTDACGRTDSLALLVDVAIGIEEGSGFVDGVRALLDASNGTAQLLLNGVTSESRITVHDSSGRLLSETSPRAAGTVRIPISGHGAFNWRIVRPDGTRHHGTVIVP